MLVLLHVRREHCQICRSHPRLYLLETTYTRVSVHCSVSKSRLKYRLLWSTKRNHKKSMKEGESGPLFYDGVLVANGNRWLGYFYTACLIGSWCHQLLEHICSAWFCDVVSRKSTTRVSVWVNEMFSSVGGNRTSCCSKENEECIYTCSAWDLSCH